jgi:hypothetical protein
MPELRRCPVTLETIVKGLAFTQKIGMALARVANSC